MVEPQPSKLMVRVRFPSPAPLDCAVDGKLFGKAGKRRQEQESASVETVDERMNA